MGVLINNNTSTVSSDVRRLIVERAGMCGIRTMDSQIKIKQTTHCTLDAPVIHTYEYSLPWSIVVFLFVWSIAKYSSVSLACELSKFTINDIPSIFLQVSEPTDHDYHVKRGHSYLPNPLKTHKERASIDAVYFSFLLAKLLRPYSLA